jgi:malonyl-CoA/methylmalonyl-CoA synthetase
VQILGRTSVDIIKTGGYKISAIEVEEALRRNPDIADAAVMGVADEEWGERVVAAVISEKRLDLDELRAVLKLELAPYKVPRQIVQVATLPRNALGKVTKHELKLDLERHAIRGKG